MKKLRHAVFVGLCEGGETHKAGVALHCGRAAARWWAERAERKGWPTLKNFRLGTSMRLRRRKDKA